MDDLTKNGNLSYTVQRTAGNGLKGQFNRVRIYWCDLRLVQASESGRNCERDERER
jgi:hypothetical protein